MMDGLLTEESLSSKKSFKFASMEALLVGSAIRYRSFRQVEIETLSVLSPSDIDIGT